ncbi:MAG: adenylate/guanylate cyclase domain-containing protein [Vulcanimicrobiaceae bacterium]
MRSSRRKPAGDQEPREALETLAGALANGDPKTARALQVVRRQMGLTTPAKSLRLARAVQLMGASLELEAVLQTALELAVDVSDAERGVLVLADGQRVAAAHGFEPAQFSDEGSAPSKTIVSLVLETGEPVFSSDASSDSLFNAELHDALSIGCVALRVRDEVIGAVYLDSCSDPALFGRDDRELLIALTSQAALAIENARLFKEERERLARITALQAFQTRILEAIANGVITFSPRRKVTTFNRAAEATFGIKAEKIVGKTATALAKVIPEFPELFDMFFSSGAVQLRAEVEAQRSDGTELVLEMRLSPLASHEGTGAALVVTDVTKQRRLEKAHEAEVTRSLRIGETFSRYLAPHVVKSLMNDPSSIKMGGQRERATMLFADICGFTSLAARLPAERVVEILNAYFEEAVRVVFDCDGLLDKFYGDGLMAVFGPPLLRDDDAARAVAAALRLHEVVGRMAPLFDEPLEISVGLATGEVVAGHIGSTMRMDYTVIGDAVNLAKGMQTAAPPGAIYCDEATLALAGPIGVPVERLAARIKGRDELIPAYAILPKQLTQRRGLISPLRPSSKGLRRLPM